MTWIIYETHFADVFAAHELVKETDASVLLRNPKNLDENFHRKHALKEVLRMENGELAQAVAGQITSSMKLLKKKQREERARLFAEYKTEVEKENPDGTE